MNRIRVLTLAASAALLALLPLEAAAQSARGASSSGGSSSAGPPVLEAVRVPDAEPAIDGLLDDAAWAQAPVATDFMQFEPNEGEPATERTEARILYGT